MALVMSTPAMASVVAFLVYAGSGHQLSPDIVFSSLTWFQMLRLPLMNLRKLRYLRNCSCCQLILGVIALSLGTITDAQNAIGRLEECFTAELISEALEPDPKLKHAVEIDNASFTWDCPPPDLKVKEDKGKNKRRGEPSPTPVPLSESEEVKEEVLFNLKHVDIKVPRGHLVAIVGAVGSGKTSLLQGLIGDMRRTGGSVRVGGSIAYCSQSAWIQVGPQDELKKAGCAEFVSRMPPFAKIFASVGLSKKTGIGKPSTMPVWNLTLTCYRTVT
jgi:ABC-type multidrug transport system fused ATPase/permease subunit